MLRNTAEGGTNGTTATPTNTGGASGDAFTSTTGGGCTIAFSTAAAMEGALGYRITSADAAQSYATHTLETPVGSRACADLLFTIPSAPTGETRVLGLFLGTSIRAGISMLSSLRARILIGSTGNAASQSPVLEVGTIYRGYLAYVPDPGGGTGAIEYRIETLSGTLIHQYTVAHSQTDQVTIARYRGGQANLGWPTQDFDTARSYWRASGWEPTAPANQAPTANAGLDQTVSPGQVVTLAGTVADPDGTATGVWTGPVALSGSGLTRTFTAPVAIDDQTLTFTLTPTDNAGLVGTPDTVDVLVRGTQYSRKTASGLQPVIRYRP